MNVLVEYSHSYDNDHSLYMFDTSKMNLNNPDDVLVKKAIDKALLDSNSQVEIDDQTSDAVENAMDRSGSYISLKLEGKMIDRHIFMFYGS